MEEILQEAMRRAEEFSSGLRDRPVVATPAAETIREHLRRSYSFDKPRSSGELVRDVGEMLESWAVHVPHPRYFGYFNPTPLPAAIAGDLLAASYNPQLAVWSHAPAAVEMEQHVLRWFTGKLGLPADTSAAHFTCGGSEANFTALLTALTSKAPDYGREGLAGIRLRPTVYHSAGAHDSFTKICHMAGLGRDALRVVDVDDGFRLDCQALRERLEADREAGETPVMVVATAGTTAAGLIDPLPEVASLCKEHDVWLHVDAAWGGAAVLSPRLRRCLEGIQEADSVTCDAHKWLNVTMGAGMFFCRHEETVSEAFRVTTDYMPSLTAGVVDPYVTSVQWSRRFIGLKLFMALAHLGESGYARMIESQAAMGGYLRDRLKAAGWTHVTQTPLPVSCVTHRRIEAGSVAAEDVLDRVLGTGRAWISTVRLGGLTALRACVTSYLTTEEDVDLLVETMTEAVAR